MKGYCKASIRGRVCPTQTRGGHQMAEHLNKRTMKKNVTEQQWIKYLGSTALCATGSEWKINPPLKEPIMQVLFLY